MVIAGLPMATWLLMLAAVGAGLAIVLAFFRAHRRDRPGNEERNP